MHFNLADFPVSFKIIKIPIVLLVCILVLSCLKSSCVVGLETLHSTPSVRQSVSKDAGNKKLSAAASVEPSVNKKNSSRPAADMGLSCQVARK